MDLNIFILLLILLLFLKSLITIFIIYLIYFNLNLITMIWNNSKLIDMIFYFIWLINKYIKLYISKELLKKYNELDIRLNKTFKYIIIVLNINNIEILNI